MYDEIKLTFEELWTKMDKYRELLLVHIGPELVPHILDPATKDLYTISEDMLNQVKVQYRKKYEKISYAREYD